MVLHYCIELVYCHGYGDKEREFLDSYPVITLLCVSSM